MTRKPILSYFPRKHVPRPVQVAVLQEVEKVWDTHDVIVIAAPTATGKSDLAYTLAKYANHAVMMAPTKVLVGQYLNDFPKLPKLLAKDDYLCPDCSELGASSCFEAARLRGSSKRPEYSPSCQYPSDLRRARVVPYLLSNYHVYMANRLYRDTLIVDEAHNVIKLIQDLNKKTLWQHKARFPDYVYNTETFVRWYETLSNPDPSISEFYRLATNSPPTHLFQRKVEEYGREDSTGVRATYAQLSLTPVDVSGSAPILWPSSVKRIVLLSATIGPDDIEALGLSAKHGHKVAYLNAASPIPVENRPVLVEPRFNMSFKTQDAELESLAAYIRDKITQHAGQNGVVHLTYGLANKLRPLLLDIPNAIWHDRNNRSAQYEQFLRVGGVLFACGLYEGIDLKGSAGEWQILTKVPFPSLADPTIRYLASKRANWYRWETLKLVMQFAGRVCRTPTDFGTSYICDNNVVRLFNDCESIMPEWFKSAIIIEETE